MEYSCPFIWIVESRVNIRPGRIFHILHNSFILFNL
jgi:hypothetical protein